MQDFEENLDFVLMWLYSNRSAVYSNGEKATLEMFNLYITIICPTPDSKYMLLEQLILDGFISSPSNNSNEAPILTDNGVRFFLFDGGYQKKRREQDIDKTIRSNTLKKYTLDKVFSIIAITISVISLCLSIYAVAIK